MERLQRLLATLPLVLVFVLFALALARPGARSDEGADRHEARRRAVVVLGAVERFLADRGAEELRRAWPPDVDVLCGPGRRPRGLEAPPAPLADLLLRDGLGVERWSGPYLDSIPVDPWGRAFVVTTRGFHDSRRRVFVLSAGPNGRLETRSHDTQPHGDDVALVARW